MLPPVSPRLLGLCALWLLSCAGEAARPAGAGAPPTALAHAPAATSGSDATGPAATDTRALPVHPTFADLLDVVRALDATEPSPGRGCLLRGLPPQRFEGDVLVGVRPLPSAPEALAMRLDQDARPVSVLSAWGTSVGACEIALVAFTTTTAASARARAVAAFVTERGIYVRGDDAALRTAPGPMPTAAFGALLAQASLDAPAVLYVSAEAAISLADVRAVLLAVPDRYEVALAVALPKGTRLPASEASTTEWLCPDGLPAPTDDEPEGAIDTAALQRALQPLHEAAASCALASGPRAWVGGRLVLALRIDPEGRARELCLTDDAVGDALLRRCLIASTRSLALPKPTPRGFVDVHLPLDLALAGPSAQRALCD